MKSIHEIELQACPACRGDGTFETESNCFCYITCMDCGCHTVEFEYSNEEELFQAAQKAAHLWNDGKVLSHNPGE